MHDYVKVKQRLAEVKTISLKVSKGVFKVQGFYFKE